MMAQRRFAFVLTLALLLFPMVGSVQAQPVPQTRLAAEAAQPVVDVPTTPAEPGLPGASAGWWGAVQEEIAQSEYEITWQEQTYLSDVAAAYQAPNRAQNLRTYFTPDGIRAIPRVYEGDSPPWEWGLALSGYGYEGAVRTVAGASLEANGNRIEYARDLLVEWYVNDERGLEQGFTLQTPPLGEGKGQIELEMALSGSLTPQLTAGGSAVEFITPGGVTVLRYGNLLVTDATGRQLPASLSLSPSRLSIKIDAASAVYPITVDPLATTPAWTAESDQANSDFGYSVGTAGDVNGDGYSDVIVGAPHYDNGQTDEGRAFVYHGSATGLGPTADWTAELDQDGAWFGNSVGTAGDVNGDGYADVIVGAPLFDDGVMRGGQAYVYHGSATGLSLTAAWKAGSNYYGVGAGYSVGTAGDVNGDGYADVIVGAPYYDAGQTDEGRVWVFHGASTGLSGSPAWRVESDQTGAWFGLSVGTAGDVNGDGYSDVIIGAPNYDNGQADEGRAFVYHGASSGLSTSAAWTAEGDQASAIFGSSVGTAGDVNGDGYSDVIVGAYLYDNGQTDEGRAYVYHGASTGLSTSAGWTAEGDQDDARFGCLAGTAGDVNGDGYADVIVGALAFDNGQTDEGRATVYHGAPTGLSTSPDWTAESDQEGAYFGGSVGTAGDVNGDGYSDVIVGAHLFDNGQTDEGRATVYNGAPTGLSTSAAWTAEGDQADAFFGYSVGTAGDVNGDGYSDVIVGAPYFDNGQTDEGRAYVYHGSSTGLSTSPDWTAEGDQSGADFGWSVGTAGDVNGDGYADVIVGARLYDNGQTNEGRAFVFHGSAAGLSSAANWTAESHQIGALFGCSVGTAGDVNGDGYADVIVGAYLYDNGDTSEGGAYVYHGASTGLSTSPAWTAEGDQSGAYFGWSVGTAGDVNGDGYSDVIVGAYRYENGQTDEGRAFVYHGAPTGLSASADWTVESDQAYGDLGYSVGTAGDVNGDGYSDVIVGAEGYTNGETAEGRAYVYHGAPTGLSTSAAWTAESDQSVARFGWSVGTAGDVNGDGYSDVIVGAYRYENGQEDEGRAFVYHGSGTGLTLTPAWTAEGEQGGANFGTSVSTAGDVNGDGYSDVIVGADGYDNGQTDEGRATVYYGNDGDGLHMLPRQLRTGSAAPIAYLGMSDSRTSFQLGLIGRMPLGREEVRLQWQVAPLGLPITATNVLSGTSDWTDVLTTGVAITQTVTGLAPGTPYHWRVRLLYEPGNALGQPAGRWIHIPWAGWNESDLRTQPNQPPVAGAGPDQSVDTLALVALDGSGSDDPEGDLPLTYGWTQTGGPGVTLSDPAVVAPTFTAPADPAVLTFALTAIDSLGLADPTPDEVVVTVNNQPPVADAGANQSVDTNASVTLDGSGSYDPDGDLPLTYGWTQTGGPGVTLSDPAVVAPTFTAPADPAVLTFTLAVTDSLGLPGLTTDEVVVTVDNQPPVADAGPDQSVDRLVLVALDGSGSDDPDEDLPLTYDWTQTGGPRVTLSDPAVVAPTFTAPADPAVLTFALTAIDSLGLADPTPDEVVVTVNNQPPVTDAGANQSVDTNASVTLDGSGSYDPDGDLPLTYGWTQTGGPGVTLSDPAVVAPTFTAPADPAVLTFTLAVTDSLGLPGLATDEVVVRVNNPAGDLHVCPSGCAYSSVQDAVDAASDDDVIKVAAGTYTDIHARNGVTQVVYVDKSVTIRGGYTTAFTDPPDPAANPTTLDAQGLGRVLYITGGVSITVEGLRITGGDAAGLGGAAFDGWDTGGGIYAVDVESLTLNNTQILTNTAEAGGGLWANKGTTTLNENLVADNHAAWCAGLAVASEAATLVGNTIRGNSTWEYSGGGLCIWPDGATLRRNFIIANSAAGWAAGGMMVTGNGVTLANNVIAGNQAATTGGGARLVETSAQLLHNTFSGNTSGDGSGILVDGAAGSTVSLLNTIVVSQNVGIRVSGGSTVTMDSVLWHNTPITVSQSITAVVTVQDQLTGDPAFDTDGYHLTIVSPAIDAGVDAGVNDDIDGNPRPYNSASDLGADELIAATVPSDTQITLVYTDTQGSPTVIQVPGGAVTEEVTLVYTPVEPSTAPPGFVFAGHAFELDAYRNGSLLSGFTFSVPVTITLHYTGADIAGLVEHSLLLEYWNGSAWVDAACGAYDRQPDENWLAVPICHLSQFALFGEREYPIYLPLVQRN